MKLSVMCCLTAFGVLPFAAAPADAAPDDPSFRIAVVVPFSGVYGILGQDIRRGIELALEERGNRVLGKPIEIMWNDDESKPQTAVQKATQAITGGGNWCTVRSVRRHRWL